MLFLLYKLETLILFTMQIILAFFSLGILALIGGFSIQVFSELFYILQYS